MDVDGDSSSQSRFPRRTISLKHSRIKRMDTEYEMYSPAKDTGTMEISLNEWDKISEEHPHEPVLISVDNNSPKLSKKKL